MLPTSLSQYYSSQGKQLPSTVQGRFTDPVFSEAAKAAGFTPQTYAINANNGDANTKILSAIISGAKATAPTTPPPTTPPPSINSTYQIPSTPTVDPNITAAQQAADTYYQNEASGTPNFDEQAIRDKAVKEMQAEIDATNALYADKLAQAKIQGEGRLGTNRAIEARRGLLGSDFGTAQTDTVNQGNDNLYSSINDEKNVAIQAILGKANENAVAEITAKNAAMKEGLDSHLKYLEDAATRTTTNATTAAQYIYDSNLTPGDLTADQLSKTAAGYGVSPDAIKSAFVDVKKTGDAAKAKVKQDAEKTLSPGAVVVDENGNVVAKGNPILPESAQEYEYAVKNGYKGTYSQYQNEDANRKARAAGVTGTVKSGAAEFTPAQISLGAQKLESAKGSDGYIDPAVYAQAFTDWVGKGALPKDFILKFPPKDYVNPANTTLPKYLLPGNLDQLTQLLSTLGTTQ